MGKCDIDVTGPPMFGQGAAPVDPEKFDLQVIGYAWGSCVASIHSDHAEVGKMTYIGSFKESTQTPQSTLNTDSEISVPAAYLLNYARDIFSRMGY